MTEVCYPRLMAYSAQCLLSTLHILRHFPWVLAIWLLRSAQFNCTSVCFSTCWLSQNSELKKTRVIIKVSVFSSCCYLPMTGSLNRLRACYWQTLLVVEWVRTPYMFTFPGKRCVSQICSTFWWVSTWTTTHFMWHGRSHFLFDKYQLPIKHLWFIGAVVRGRDTEVSKPWGLLWRCSGDSGGDRHRGYWDDVRKTRSYLLLSLLRLHCGDTVRGQKTILCSQKARPGRTSGWEVIAQRVLCHGWKI